MGTTLTGTTPQDTYDSLIKVTDNGPLSGTAKYLSDGLGNDSILALSTARVGLGTATPSAMLTLNGLTPYIRIERTGVPTWQIQNNTLVAAAGLSINNITNATTPFFINGTTDNVGIGTGAPVSKLNVNGVITASAGAQSNPTGGASIVVDYQTTSDLQGRVRSRDWDGGLWKNLRFEGENIIVSPSGTEVGRFTSNGLTFNGDTAAANALDDYEEGTWTPTVTAPSGTATYTTQFGSYTKIGRQVTVNWFVSFQKNTLSGGVKLSNLPFALAALSGSNYPQAIIMLDNLASAYDNPLIQFVNGGTDADIITGNGSTGSHAALQDTQLGAGTMSFRGTATYFA